MSLSDKIACFHKRNDKETHRTQNVSVISELWEITDGVIWPILEYAQSGQIMLPFGELSWYAHEFIIQSAR